MNPVRFILAASILAASSSAFAATATKASSGTDLTGGTAGVWTGGSGTNGSPTSTDVATWTSTSLGAGLTAATDVTWGSINITGAANNIAITGAGIINTGNITLAGNRTLSIANAVALTGNSIYDIADVASGTDATLSGAISGAFGITKSGAGSLSLTNATNGYSGGTTVSAGVLNAGNSTATNFLGSGAVTVNSGATLNLGTSRATYSAITLNGSGASGLSGALLLGGGSSFSSITVTNLTVASNATIGTSNSQGNGNSIAGAISIGSNTLTFNPLTPAGFETTESLTLTAAISGTGGIITQGGPGQTTLNAVNTYTGGTNINAGVLAVANASALGSSGTIAFGGGTLKYSGVNTDFSSRFSTAANQAISVDTNGQNVTFAGALTSSGGTLTKLGTGTLSLTNTGNTYTGPITVSAGVLSAGTSNSTNFLGTGATTVNSGATLNLNASRATTYGALTLNGIGDSSFSGALVVGGQGSFSDVTFASIALNSSATIGTANSQGNGNTIRATGGISLGANTLIFNPLTPAGFPTSESLTIAGAISGTAGIIQGGPGQTTLSGINTYTGNTTVSAGTLALADNAGLKFVIGLNGVNNGISGIGNLTLNGDFTFDLTSAGTTLNDLWQIVDNTSLTETYTSLFTVAGFTDNLNDTWSKNANGVTYTFSEGTGALSVTAVPEPGALSALLGGAGVLLGLRRRRS